LSLLAQRKETKESALFPEVFLTEKVWILHCEKRTSSKKNV